MRGRGGKDGARFLGRGLGSQGPLKRAAQSSALSSTLSLTHSRGRGPFIQRLTCFSALHTQPPGGAQDTAGEFSGRAWRDFVIFFYAEMRGCLNV